MEQNEIPVIQYQKWITRQNLRNNPDTIYIFGDNVERLGYGGQAKEMRGEPNALGIATKFSPDMNAQSFFSDSNGMSWIAVKEDIAKLQFMIDNGHRIIVPYDGLGTGLSQLPIRAPRIYGFLYQYFYDLSDGFCPWEQPTMINQKV